jgi:hypothetical protein
MEGLAKRENSERPRVFGLTSVDLTRMRGPHREFATLTALVELSASA